MSQPIDIILYDVSQTLEKIYVLKMLWYWCKYVTLFLFLFIYLLPFFFGFGLKWNVLINCKKNVGVVVTTQNTVSTIMSLSMEEELNIFDYFFFFFRFSHSQTMTFEKARIYFSFLDNRYNKTYWPFDEQ